MSKEFSQDRLPDRESLPGIDKRTGWQNYQVENNEWLSWAKENNLDLEEQIIKTPRPKTFRRSALGKIPRIPRRVFMESPWTKWFDKRVKAPISFTIDEYKRTFQGRLPDYALSFRAQGLDESLTESTRHRMSFTLPMPHGPNKVWHVERERYLKFQKPHERIYVERLYDIGGRLTDVTLLHFFATNIAFALENHKISPHKWDCERKYVEIEPYPPVPYKKYFKSEMPWQLTEL